MKKLLFSFLALFCSVYVMAQNQGTYLVNYNDSAYAKAYVYKKKTSGYLIYLDVNSGKPSYNMGGGMFNVNYDRVNGFCKIDTVQNFLYKFRFKGNTLTTKLQYGDLGWGNGVSPNFTAKRLTRKNPLYFNSVGTGEKVYFRNVSNNGSF
ncbi:hypothetical protein DU508_01575 [Pedobacter chinensis]|uniref:Uncharacterized protein n=1 Tax=Pedobacter chinensis TaxID=2282421 RepID=A0A369Q358_9SPHI|nr:hypothetical protein [Pedobacter chinensis]RDC57677.1 hypothetical protein DU508_01575 [Pedobacter chinensis]